MGQKQMSDKGDRASEFLAEIHLRIEGKYNFIPFSFNDTLPSE